MTIKRRDFVKNVGLAGVGLTILPMWSCDNSSESAEKTEKIELKTGSSPLNFILPELGFAYNALAPIIDAETMEIHHSKHHAGYVKKLNNALEKSNIGAESLVDLFEKLEDKEEHTNLRNNGGGHYNHAMFWETLKPGNNELTEGELLTKINDKFGSVDLLKEEFSAAAVSVFGSGWAWLCANENQELFISATPNQDNPLMKNIVNEAGTPLLGIDVWEHAYYLNYQNQRKKYIDGFWPLINWNEVGNRFKKIV